MEKREQRKNFIMYLFLVILLFTGVGYGFSEECQVFSLCLEEAGSSISAPAISANKDLHTFQVRERNSVTLRHNNLRNNRSQTFSRGKFAILCILAILSIFFRLIQEVFVHFRRLYVHDRFYMISFMQDMDGRKRIS